MSNVRSLGNDDRIEDAHAWIDELRAEGTETVIVIPLRPGEPYEMRVIGKGVVNSDVSWYLQHGLFCLHRGDESE